MGYRLNAIIKNVGIELSDGSFANRYLELGKQYNHRWYSFNAKWFGDDIDSGDLSKEHFKEFLNDIELINAEIANHDEGYQLYNLELLKELMDLATENNYILSFESY